MNIHLSYSGKQNVKSRNAASESNPGGYGNHALPGDGAVNMAPPLSIAPGAAPGGGDRKLFIKGLSFDTTVAAFEKIYTAFGQMEECEIPTDKTTGRGKGYGFIKYKFAEDAQKAVQYAPVSDAQ